ncbi:MAG TPA: histidine phosphatase family protein [Galbitalea sp.]|jgi:broad specificity phosphatase PhoE|nr:histidine phosphatase family protein [Galbitalea sp.]
MTSLYLVRHGETDWNAERRIQGSTDIPLNRMGKEQAAATGRLLARRSWDGAFSSPLSRALETATIIANAVGLVEVGTMDAIVERNYGEAEGLDWQEIDRLFPGDAEVPGRESHQDVADRVVPALLELAASRRGQSLIVVTHGGVIRSVLNAVQPDRWHGSITNGSIHSFEVVDGSLELVAFDDPIEELSMECGTDGLDEQNAVESRETMRG